MTKKPISHQVSLSGTSIFGLQKDHHYMREALKQAQRAIKYDEVPIGAVVVNTGGTIIGRGYNQVEKRKTQSAHAEIIAINKATQKQKDWRLDGCWLYVTLEPCNMCMGLITLSRLAGVVFGASSPLYGFRLDNRQQVSVYQIGTPVVVAGIGEQESVVLLQTFFKQKRKKGEWQKY